MTWPPARDRYLEHTAAGRKPPYLAGRQSIAVAT